MRDVMTAADPGYALSFGRLVTEFGVVSMQALNDWAESALDRIGCPDPTEEASG